MKRLPLALFGSVLTLAGSGSLLDAVEPLGLQAGKALLGDLPVDQVEEAAAKVIEAEATALKIVIKEQSKARTIPVLAGKDGVLRLAPADAELRGDLKLGQLGDKDLITGWLHARDPISWELEVPKNGSYQVFMQTACQHEGAVILIQGKGLSKLACAVPKTENLTSFEKTRVGDVKLNKGERVMISLQPVADGWRPVNLRMVELVPRP